MFEDGSGASGSGGLEWGEDYAKVAIWVKLDFLTRRAVDSYHAVSGLWHEPRLLPARLILNRPTYEWPAF
jgi:hypothetical protein